MAHATSIEMEKDVKKGSTNPLNPKLEMKLVSFWLKAIFNLKSLKRIKEKPTKRMVYINFIMIS